MKLEKSLNKHKIELSDLDLKPISSDQFNIEIDQSINDAVQGRIITAKNLKSKIRNNNSNILINK